MDNLFINKDTHDYYLFEEIKESKHYVKLFNHILNLNEIHTFRLFIDCIGGSVSGAIIIVEALKNTKAKVEIHAVGHCENAAFIILLDCIGLNNITYKLYDNSFYNIQLLKSNLPILKKLLDFLGQFGSTSFTKEQLESELKKFKNSDNILDFSDLAPMSCSMTTDMSKLELWVGENF
jgi:hypothetical protein